MGILIDGNCSHLPLFGMRLDASPPVITNLPDGVLKIRIRERLDCLTVVFLKFADRIEAWHVKADGEYNSGRWRLLEPAFDLGRNSVIRL